MKAVTISLAVLLAGLAAGCQGGLGPTSIRMNRRDFNAAVQDTAKQQVLLNIMRLRNDDTPLFLEVVSIASQMTVKTEGSVKGKPTDFMHHAMDLSGTAGYTDMPTIGYGQVTGDNLVKQLLSPIGFDSIVVLYNSGWKIDQLFLLTVEQLSPDVVNHNSGDNTKFLEAIRQLRILQDEKQLQLSYVKGAIDPNTKLPKEPDQIVVTVRDNGVQVATSQPSTTQPDALNSLAQTLNLGPLGVTVDGTKKLVLQQSNVVAVGATTRGGAENTVRTLSIRTRPILGALTELANHASETENSAAVSEQGSLTLTIHKSVVPPLTSYTNTFYMDHWYYISEQDKASKQMFNLVSQLLMVQSGNIQNSLLLTLPVGGGG
jgi:hypothetical protein